jgi:hypothetical protein
MSNLKVDRGIRNSSFKVIEKYLYSSLQTEGFESRTFRIILECKKPGCARRRKSHSEIFHNLFLLPNITRVRTMEMESILAGICSIFSLENLLKNYLAGNDVFIPN